MKAKYKERIVPLFEDKRNYLSKNGFFYTERHLQCVWFASSLRPQNLIAITNEEVIVENPGEWNTEPGPDFLNATLKVGKERKLLNGDIEIHIEPQDWLKHNHSSDPRYKNVIAHITYFPGKLPDGTLPKDAIEISLQEPLSKNPTFSFDAIDISAIPELPRVPLPPCQKILKSLSPEIAELLLDEAGKTRITMKAERIKKLIQEIGKEQAFYEETMAAVGFKNNTSQMRKLAKLIPLKTLQEESEEDPEKAFALLLGVSGLLPTQTQNSFDKESKIIIRKMWDWWWKKNSIWLDNKMQQTEWTLYGIRPQNHPQRRLLAIAYLFIGQKEPLLEKIQKLFTKQSANFKILLKELSDTLVVKAPDYWQTHILLGNPTKKFTNNLIGEGRFASILINIIVPFLIALGNKELINSDFLSIIPAEDDNIIVRRAARNLFGRDHNPNSLYNTALRQQGLIQIYHDFCSIDKSMCNNCQLANALKLQD